MAKRCDQCQVAVINGVRCHETGCPAAWRDEVRECRECGCQFDPDSRGQRECCEECHAAYHNLPYWPDGMEDDWGPGEASMADDGPYGRIV